MAYGMPQTNWIVMDVETKIPESFANVDSDEHPHTNGKEH